MSDINDFICVHHHSFERTLITNCPVCLQNMCIKKDVEIANLRHQIGTDFMAAVVIEKDETIDVLKQEISVLCEQREQRDKRIAELEVDLAKGEYEKTFLVQQQRLAEARRLIGHFGWTSSEDTAVIRGAEKWLEGKP